MPKKLKTFGEDFHEELAKNKLGDFDKLVEIKELKLKGDAD